MDSDYKHACRNSDTKYPIATTLANLHNTFFPRIERKVIILQVVSCGKLTEGRWIQWLNVTDSSYLPFSIWEDFYTWITCSLHDTTHQASSVNTLIL